MKNYKMFYLYSHIVVGAAGGGAKVVRSVKESTVKLVITMESSGGLVWDLDGETPGNDFWSTQGHLGYQMNYGDFFITPYAFGGYMFGPSRYISNYGNAGVGCQVGLKTQRLAVFVGGGAAVSWIKNVRYDVKNPSPNNPHYFETQAAPYLKVYQPFLCTGAHCFLNKKIAITFQYRCMFNGLWSDQAATDYKSDHTFSRNLPKASNYDKDTFTLEPSLTLMSHVVLVGIDYHLQGGIS